MCDRYDTEEDEDCLDQLDISMRAPQALSSSSQLNVAVPAHRRPACQPCCLCDQAVSNRKEDKVDVFLPHGER
ncbi:hypothetical protein J4Q44_G00253680 [Coregonus suidteri]|uniref:Uncharacterized protein n=1 Tax=Coregonus suidteri TaxID=861788 RepID=A0AAN8LAW7_9TELE